MSAPTLVVVGASLAGARAAEGARDAGFEGRIVLVGDEAADPYERPPLSKAILRGEAEPDTARVHPEGFYDEHAIERVTDQVVVLDIGSRRVDLASGERLGFDAAVLATGAAPRRLDVQGADLAGVHVLRTMDDAVRLRDALRSATRVAVIGAGWIGSEVAASARQVGADVVLVDPAPVPLHRVLGNEVGAVFAHLHADNGVALRLGRGVAELRGAKTVEAVVLDDGSVEPADVVVAGVGAVPRVELAAAAGLHVDDGVVVDARLATGAEGVYAAGDVASAWHQRYGRHLRVEHWANARHQGSTAGANAAGQRDEYSRLPYFFSDQYDLGMEYVGHAGAGDALVVRGDLGARQFVAFWHDGGVVNAAMHVDRWDVVDDLKALVGSGRPVDVRRLADPDEPLVRLR